MARLHGGFLLGQITGKLGGNTYYRSKKGNTIVRKCTPIGKERFATDPKLEYMRRNVAEFSRAAKAVKLFLDALGDTGKRLRSSRCFANMQREMMKVIKSDKLNAHGMRNLTDGNLQELEGFHLNEEFKQFSFSRATQCQVNRKRGSLGFTFRDFLNTSLPANVKNVRCQRVIAMAVAINFDTGVFFKDEKKSEMLALGNNAIELRCQLPKDNRDTWFLMGGIEWYRQCDMHFGESRYHTLSILQVSGMDEAGL